VNLLFNAIEAMDCEGKVSISTDLISDESSPELREGETPKLLRIRISDTGAGIQPDQLNHIFEPFFTTKETGTGLGLAVTRRIIKEHKGSIHVESAPGKGTTFVILLPAYSGKR
jgi:signal transduction histidine kinase